MQTVMGFRVSTFIIFVGIFQLQLLLQSFINFRTFLDEINSTVKIREFLYSFLII